MRRRLTYSSLLYVLIASSTGWSQSFNLQNLSADDYAKVVDDFSANFSHTSVSGASPLGHIYGFELGVVGGKTQTPNINRLVHESDPTVDASSIPMAELLGVLTVPFGLTGELGLIPKVGKDDFHYNSFSLAVKWTASDLLELPLSLAVKAHLTKFHMDSKQVINSVDTKYNYDSTVTGLTLLASKDFGIVEPYVGLGILNGKGDMDVTGVSAFASGQSSASATRSGTEFMLGAEVKLLVVKLGAEYGHLFGTDRVVGKLSLFF